MSTVTHPSCAPGADQLILERSLRKKQIPPAFLYHSPEQARLWQALHQKHSPAVNDPGCLQIYEALAKDTWKEIGDVGVVLIGLGCADGKKEATLVGQGRAVAEFLAVDISSSLAKAARQVVPAKVAQAVVLDLASAVDFPAFLEDLVQATHRRIVTLFGVLPNLEPGPLLSSAVALLRPGDLLLLSANLAPGDDYRTGVERILPQYDNAATRAWLTQAMRELGGDPGHASLEFTIETVDAQHRIAADFHISNPMKLGVGSVQVPFASGERLRAFHSCRHTPALIGKMLAAHGMDERAAHITPSGEEGVWLARRQ